MAHLPKKRPYIILNAAMTLDGKIATKTGDSKISCRNDLVRVHNLRASVDAIMVGVNTILVDDPELTVRLVNGRNPLRVVVDSEAKTPASSKVVRSSKDVSTLIAVTNKAPADRIEKLRRAEVEVLVSGEGDTVDLSRLFETLKDRGVGKMLVEGGGNINWDIVSQGLFDEMSISISPVIVGGREAVSLVEGEGVSKVCEGVRMKLYNVERYGSDLVLSYRPLR